MSIIILSLMGGRMAIMAGVMLESQVDNLVNYGVAYTEITFF